MPPDLVPGGIFCISLTLITHYSSAYKSGDACVKYIATLKGVGDNYSINHAESPVVMLSR